jgi:hypothetical protein
MRVCCWAERTARELVERWVGCLASHWVVKMAAWKAVLKADSRVEPTAAKRVGRWVEMKGDLKAVLKAGRRAGPWVVYSVHR